MAGGFQTAVNVQPAPAVAGDFCDHNPRWSVDAGPGGLVAGTAGLSVAQFAWLSYSASDGDGAPAIANNFGSGPVAGFVHREQQALMLSYLADAGMVVPSGFPVTLMGGGGFWIKNSGTTQALPGMKVYAAFSTGLANFALTASPSTATGTASSIAASTNSFTGTIVGNIVTATASVTGTIQPGTTLSGTNVATGTQIIAQISGTPGGLGTYSVNIPEQNVASTAISGTYGTLTIGGTVTGVYGLGDTLSGSSVVAGTSITGLITGTGGAGTYAVNNNTVVSSTTVTGALNIETGWVAKSAGAAGELVKVSNLPFS
jgi:hypothetical protein